MLISEKSIKIVINIRNVIEYIWICRLAEVIESVGRNVSFYLLNLKNMTEFLENRSLVDYPLSDDIYKGVKGEIMNKVKILGSNLTLAEISNNEFDLSKILTEEKKEMIFDDIKKISEEWGADECEDGYVIKTFIEWIKSLNDEILKIKSNGNEDLVDALKRIYHDGYYNLSVPSEDPFEYVIESIQASIEKQKTSYGVEKGEEFKTDGNFFITGKSQEFDSETGEFIIENDVNMENSDDDFSFNFDPNTGELKPESLNFDKEYLLIQNIRKIKNWIN